MVTITKYPISEIFISPQGEGLYTGALMAFIRLAGCNVGKRYEKAFYKKSAVPALPIYTEQCTLYDGRTFACDTDYRKKESLTSEEIMQRIPAGIKHACITGGEPFLHNLGPLCATFANMGMQVHIETSGTRPLSDAFDASWNWPATSTWITVSPKLGVLDEMLVRANEIKLLVDENFDIAKVPRNILGKLIYIQPVNFEHSINEDNLKLCLELQKKFPSFRLSTQQHKVWGVR